jgi:hypothetical protein
LTLNHLNHLNKTLVTVGHLQLEGGARELSTAPEMWMNEFRGTCFRCGQFGHWAESENCPWLRKAASPKEHLARIDALRMRFLEREITPHQKRDYIRHENQLWKAGKT